MGRLCMVMLMVGAALSSVFCSLHGVTVKKSYHHSLEQHEHGVGLQSIMDSEVDCVVRKAALTFASNLIPSSFPAVFDALQLHSKCNVNESVPPLLLHRSVAQQERSAVPLHDNQLVFFVRPSKQLHDARSHSHSHSQHELQQCEAAIRFSSRSHHHLATLLSLVHQAPHFHSLHAAVDCIVHVRSSQLCSSSLSSSPSCPVAASIVLRGGVHSLSSPLVLSHSVFHSNLHIRSLVSLQHLHGDGEREENETEEEAAVISGGITLQPTWTQQPNGVFVTPLPASVTLSSFNSLFVNGRRAIRARHPNGNPETSGFHTPTNTGYLPSSAGTWTPPRPYRSLLTEVSQHTQRSGHFATFQIGINGPAEVFDPPMSFWATSNPPAGGQFHVPSGVAFEAGDIPSKWSDPSTAVVHAFHSGHWGNWMFEVASAEVSPSLVHPSSSLLINLTFGAGGFQEARGDVRGGEFYVENVFELLDDDDEWFVDVATARLFYKANATLNMSTATFVASQTTSLIQIQGLTNTQPVVNVSVENIIFQHTATAFLKKFAVPSGGDWSVHKSGVVSVENAENISVGNNQFFSFGNNGVAVLNYTRFVTIHDNEFVWGEASGVIIVGVTLLSDGYNCIDQPYHTVVRGNHFHELGIFVKQSAPIFNSVAAVTTIENNVMYNLPRAGICFNDGFGGGSLVQNNLIFGSVRETSDHGPFNSWDRQPYFQPSSITNASSPSSLVMSFNTVHHNFFINEYNSVWPIDHDDGSAYYRDTSNLLVYGGFKNYLGHSRIVTNNIYIYPDGNKAGATFFNHRHNDDEEEEAQLQDAPWGSYCIEDFDPMTGDSGYADTYVNNTCVMLLSGSIYRLENCDVTILPDRMPFTQQNAFYVPQPINITCGTSSYSLDEWTKTTQYDEQSTEQQQAHIDPDLIDKWIQQWMKSDLQASDDASTNEFTWPLPQE